MVSVYDIKPAFQGLLRPAAKRLAEKGVTANQVTISACLLSVLSGLFIWLSGGGRVALITLPVVLFLRMALNAIDGVLAREHAMQTDLGAILNELGDVVSDAALYLPLVVLPGIPAALVAAIVWLALLSEMTGVLGVQIGAGRRYDGPMGKSDRAFVFGAVGLLLGAGVHVGVWLTVVLWIVAALLILTILNRARQALCERS